MFKKAVRARAKLKLCLTGPSGSGKTLSALKIAKGIGGKIAVIDTENDSATLYAGREDVPEFDVLNLAPPYTTDKYLAAINAALAENYDLLIIDSGSHQWAGEGGLLQRKEQLDQRGGDSFRNWGKMTPEQEKFKSAILHFPKHLIMTLRSKQDYAMSTNEKGKASIQKLGLAPIQREGMEYEFTLVLDIDMGHQAMASKDRTGLFDGKLFVPSEQEGKVLKNWLEQGICPPTPTDIASVASLCRELGCAVPKINSKDQAENFIQRLMNEKKKREEKAGPAIPVQEQFSDDEMPGYAEEAEQFLRNMDEGMNV
jgi:hypothetical protein